MRQKKGLFFSLLGLLLALLTFSFLITLPSFQTQVLRAIIALKKEEGVKIDRINIGLHHLQAQGMSFKTRKGDIFIDRVQMRLDLLPLIFQRKVQIDELEISSLAVTLDSRETRDANTSDVSSKSHKSKNVGVDFKGLFETTCQFDYFFWIERIELKGTVCLRDKQVIPFIIKAKNIAPGKTGEILFSLQFEHTSSSLSLEGVLALTQDNIQPGFTAVHLETTWSIDHPIFQQPKVLQGRLDLKKQVNGESYQAEMFQFEPNGDKTVLANLNSVFDSSEKRLFGKFNIQARRKDLPLERLPLLTQWEEIPIIESQFDLQWYWSNLYLDHLQCRIKDREEQTLAFIKNLQPFHFSSSQKNLAGVLPKGKLFEVELRAFPLKMAPFDLGKYSIDGTITGAWVLSEKDNAYDIQPSRSSILNQLALEHDDHSLFKHLTLTMHPQLQLKEDVLHLSVKDISAVYRDSFLLKETNLTATVDKNDTKWLTTSLEGEGEIQLETLSSLPIFAHYNNLDQGQLTWQVEGERDANSGYFTVTSDIQNIVVATDKEQTNGISSIQLKGYIHWYENNFFSAQLPLTLTSNNGTSSLLLEGQLSQEKEAHFIDVQLSGPSLDANDLLLLASIFKKTTKEKTTTETSTMPIPLPGVVDKPSKYSGKAKLDIKTVFFKNQKILEKLDSSINFSKTGFHLTKMNAWFEQSPLSIKGNFFLKNKISPFSLDAEIVLDQFDIGAFIQKLNKPSSPILEGIFDLKGKINSKSVVFENLIDQLQGEVILEGKEGSFYPLSTTTDKTKEKEVQFPMKLATEGLNMVSSFVGYQTELILQTNKVINELRVIPYDTLKLKISRAEDLNIMIDEITLLSPSIHLSAKGVILHEEGIPLNQQALFLPIKLSVKPGSSIAKTLNEIRLIENKMDERGYLQGPTCIQDGSLSNPRNNLQEILTAAIMTKFFKQKQVDLDEYKKESKPSANTKEKSIFPFDFKKKIDFLDMFKLNN